MKILIINFNRITLPSQMADWLSERGCEPIFVDNNSDYAPLLEYYYKCPYTVVRMGKNYGHQVVWQQGLLDKLRIGSEYIVTDPDLDLSKIPNDFLPVLKEGLRRYPQFSKCGFSLEINDIPHQCTINWETKFWKQPLDEQYFDAIIDTTFALYKTKEFSYSAIRTNRPYIARHVPWYYTWVKDLPEDEQYYYNTQSADIAEHSQVKGRVK